MLSLRYNIVPMLEFLNSIVDYNLKFRKRVLVITWIQSDSHRDLQSGTIGNGKCFDAPDQLNGHGSNFRGVTIAVSNRKTRRDLYTKTGLNKTLWYIVLCDMRLYMSVTKVARTFFPSSAVFFICRK